MCRRDWLGLLIAFGVLGAMLGYRAMYVEPRDWGTLCAAATAPLACGPRAALLWLQHWQLWGAGALGLGLWAFLGWHGPDQRQGEAGPGSGFAVRVAAVALGAVAVVNYNASWGMLGLALGAWAWIGAARRPA